MVNCGVPSSVLDERDEAEMSRLLERMGRRFTLVNRGVYAVGIAVFAVAYYEVDSVTLALLAALLTLFALTVDVFELESHAEYVTDAPIDAVRAEFGGPRPPLLYSYWHGADDVTTEGDTVTYVGGTDDHSDDVRHRVADRSAESISGRLETQEREILSWTVRLASEADGTRVFLTGNPSSGKGLATLVGLLLAGAIEPEAMALMGYRYVDDADAISLRSPFAH